MKKLILSICLLAVIAGCKKKEDTSVNVWVNTYPKSSNDVVNISYTIGGVKFDTTVRGVTHFNKVIASKSSYHYELSIKPSGDSQYGCGISYKVSEKGVTQEYKSTGSEAHTLSGTIN